ncbi:MAG: ABC transporter permease [Bacteroidales bacterium]|jgi:ABC-2 type transport system permease protein|nr:ABC transporter permease [Bacteroidales bacterium]
MRIFIIKEFLQIFRDKRSLIILFGIPIVQVLLFGFALKNEIQDIPIAILDKSKDVYSQQLINKIISSDYFVLEEDLQEEKAIEEAFRKGKIKQLIIIENDFSEKLEKKNRAVVQLILDASNPNTASMINSYTSAILRDFEHEINPIPTRVPMVIPETQMRYNPELRSVFMFVPGVITIILMLVSAMMTSISIAREKELGTMEVLLVSPVKPIQIIVGKVLPYVLLSFSSAVIILIMAYTAFQMPMVGNLVLLLAESLLFIVMALALGIFISTVANSQQTAMLLSMFALLLPSILLTGFIFPIKNMPEILQYVSQLMPPKWFVIIIKNIMIKGNGIESIWKETLIILGFTVFFIGLSVKKFKTRLE